MRIVVGVLMAALAAALSVSVATPVAAAPAVTADPSVLSGPGELQVISHNIAGGMTHSGSAAALNPVIHEVVNNGRHADVIALQEVCAQQATHFANTMVPYGYIAWWQPRVGHAKCGADIGELIAVKSQFFVHWANHEFGGGIGRLTCAVIAKVRSILACSTHLPSGAENATQRVEATRQMKNVGNHHMGLGMGVVMAGDFNSHPHNDAMDRMYTIGGGGGPYNEADQTHSGSPQRSGQWTHEGGSGGRGKIDYVFFSTNMSRQGTGLNMTVLRHMTYSDHALILGSTVIR